MAFGLTTRWTKMRRKSLIDLHSWKDPSHIYQGHPRNCIAMLWQPPTSLALWLQVFTFVQCNSSFSKLNGSPQGSVQEAINWLFCKSFDWLCACMSASICDLTVLLSPPHLHDWMPKTDNRVVCPPWVFHPDLPNPEHTVLLLPLPETQQDKSGTDG